MSAALIGRCAALIVAALALGWAFLRWFERANLYFPDRTLYAHPGSFGLAYREARFPAADGVRLHGWFVEKSPGAPLIILCHGNAGNISNRLEKLRLLLEAGASVLLFDYRGYGGNEGRPSEQGTYLDGEAALRYATGVLKLDPSRVVLHGESLGAAVAAETALRHPVGGLILESGFTSVPDMARLLLPWLPVRLVSLRYDTLSKIGRIRCPVLVMHSPQDEIVPYEMGRRVFAAAREPKTFAALSGGHNEGFLESERVFVASVRKFLDDAAPAKL